MSQLILKDAILHRHNITAADEDAPENVDIGVKTNYSEQFLVFVKASGTPTAEITPYWYEEGTKAFYRDNDQAIKVEESGNTVHKIENKGALLFLRVDSISGADASLNIYVSTRRLRLR